MPKVRIMLSIKSKSTMKCSNGLSEAAQILGKGQIYTSWYCCVPLIRIDDEQTNRQIHKSTFADSLAETFAQQTQFHTCNIQQTYSFDWLVIQPMCGRGFSEMTRWPLYTSVNGSFELKWFNTLLFIKAWNSQE